MSYPQRSATGSTTGTGMTSHPEMAEMRERLERTASSGRAMAVEGLIVLAGLYVAISPWAVHFATQRNITVNNLIIGLAIALIGAGLTMVPERTYRLAWVLAPLGLWLLISPWVVTQTHSARAGIVVTGTEVLTGRVQDLNGPWLADRLLELGVELAHITICGDRPEDIEAHDAAVRPACHDRHLVWLAYERHSARKIEPPSSKDLER